MTIKATITGQELMSCVVERELRHHKGKKWARRALAARLIVYGYGAGKSTVVIAADQQCIENVREALYDFPQSLDRFNSLIQA